MIWLLLLACGPPSDYCERVAAVQATCDATDPGSGDVESCLQSLKDCSDADLAVLDAFATCLDGIDCAARPREWYDCAAVLVDLDDPACGT